ncbi:putative reverse transcriptase zinc-binding domain-containing protein [Helianthus annuus]|nr:putative reverse transcriptase zinc-binding domain-containing protein [Helianthus annuus]
MRIIREGDKVSLADSWVMETTTVEAISEAQDVVSMISQVQFAGGKDLWVWEPDKNGDFTVAAVKKWLRKDGIIRSKALMKWETWVPVKVNIFVWRMEIDRIPTRLALLRRKINIPNVSCPLCETVDESVQHLMVECGFTFGVWSKIWNWCRINGCSFYSVNDLLKMEGISFKSKWERKVIRGVFMVTCWAIWKERNKKVFQSSTPRVLEIVATVKALSYFWFKHRTRFKNVVWNEWVKYPLYCL